ncbi:MULTISPECIES: hypothetical protein [Flavobacterium]|uniref:hypothetical protein n=1 Tax=Flavobacterium TaxID=237 RepID=UPI001FCAD538|nr:MULTISPECIES: hypothetical protein [Flavobacterium]UOK42224.1 hypothetical protein LZF87_13005 [Flavobacterium enshiense]
MNVIKKYFTAWWIPIISYLLPLLIYVLGTILKSDDVIDFSLIVFYINILGNLISSIVQIVIKKWYFSVLQILISGFLFFYVSLIFTFSPPDYYGVNKTIPKNIKIESPIGREINENDLLTNDLKIASISQPGIYNFYTNYQPKEKGTLYIKAYEITSNDRLSEERMTEQSKVSVENQTEKLYSGEFTIYEGSWDDKYGARIELWFKPKNGNEYKITEKNYIVEGWMR